MTRVSRRKTLSHSELENFLNEIDVASDLPQPSSVPVKPVATFEQHSHLPQSPQLTSPAPAATVDPLRAEVQSIRQFCRATFATYRSGIPLEPTKDLCDVGREILAGSSYPVLSRRLLCPNDYLYPSSSIEGKKALLMSLSPMLTEADEQRKKETAACENFTRCKSSKGKSKFSSYDYVDIDVKCQVDFAEYEKRYLLYIAYNKKTYARESPLSPSINYITLQHRHRTHRIRSNSTTSSNGSTSGGGFPRRNLQHTLNSAATRSSPVILTGDKSLAGSTLRADTENTAPHARLPVPPPPPATTSSTAPQLRSPVAVAKPPAPVHPHLAKHRIEPQPVKLDDSTMELLAALRKPKQSLPQPSSQAQAPLPTAPFMQQPHMLSPPSKAHAQQPAQVLWAPQPPAQPAPSLQFQSPRSQRSPPSAQRSPTSPTSVPPSPVAEPATLVTQTADSSRSISPAMTSAMTEDQGSAGSMMDESYPEGGSDMLCDPLDGGLMEFEDSIIERLRRGRSSSERKRKHGRGTSQSPRSSAEGSLGNPSGAAAGDHSDIIPSGVKQQPRQQARRGTLSPGSMRAMLLEACTNPGEETEEATDISLVDEDEESVMLGYRPRGQARRGTLSPASVRAMLLAACAEEDAGGMAVELEGTTETVVVEDAAVQSDLSPAASNSARTPPTSGTKSVTASPAVASPAEHLHRLESAVSSHGMAEADLLGLSPEPKSAQKDRVKKLARSGSPTSVPTPAYCYDAVVQPPIPPEQNHDQEDSAMAVESAYTGDDVATMPDAPTDDYNSYGDNDDDGACIDFAAEMIVFSGGRASYAPSRRRSSLLPAAVHIWDLPTASRTPSPEKEVELHQTVVTDVTEALTVAMEAPCDQAEEVTSATDLVVAEVVITDNAAQVGDVSAEDSLSAEQSGEVYPAEELEIEQDRDDGESRGDAMLTGAEQEAVATFGRELDDILCDVSTLGAPLSPYGSSQSGSSSSGRASDDGVEELLCFSPYVPPPSVSSQYLSQTQPQTPSQRLLSPQQVLAADVWSTLSPPLATERAEPMQSTPVPVMLLARSPLVSRQQTPAQTPGGVGVGAEDSVPVASADQQAHADLGPLLVLSPQCDSVVRMVDVEVVVGVEDANTVSVAMETLAGVPPVEGEHVCMSPVVLTGDAVASPELEVSCEASEAVIQETSSLDEAALMEAASPARVGTDAPAVIASPVNDGGEGMGEESHQDYNETVVATADEIVPDCDSHAADAMAVELKVERVVAEGSPVVEKNEEGGEVRVADSSAVSAASEGDGVLDGEDLWRAEGQCKSLTRGVDDSGFSLSEDGEDEDVNNTSMDDSVLLYAETDPELDDFQMLESLVEQEYQSGELQGWDFGGLGGLGGLSDRAASAGGSAVSSVTVSAEHCANAPSSPTIDANIDVGLKPALSPVQAATSAIAAISSTPAAALGSPMFAYAVSSPCDGRLSALSGRRHSGIPRYASSSPTSTTTGAGGVSPLSRSTMKINKVTEAPTEASEVVGQDPMRMSMDGTTVEVSAGTTAPLASDSAVDMELPEPVDLAQAAARAQVRYEERVAVARWKQLWEVVSAHAVNAAIDRLRRQT